MQIALLGQRHGAPKEIKLDQWYYPVEKIHMQESPLMLRAEGKRIFGKPARFEGKCEKAGSPLRKDNCTIYYQSSISGIKEGILRFLARGKGKFRISVYSAAGFVSRKVELSQDADTITLDLSGAIAITQHGGQDPLRIVFVPLDESFEIEVSNFVLE